jgi:hypothetical protein
MQPEVSEQVRLQPEVSEQVRLQPGVPEPETPLDGWEREAQLEELIDEFTELTPSPSETSKWNRPPSSRVVSTKIQALVNQGLTCVQLDGSDSSSTNSLPSEVSAYLIDGSVVFIRTATVDIVTRIETEQVINSSGVGIRIWIRKHAVRVWRLKKEVSNINLVTKFLDLVYRSFFGITQPISFSCDPLSVYTPQEVQQYWKLIKRSSSSSFGHG